VVKHPEKGGLTTESTIQTLCVPCLHLVSYLDQALNRSGFALELRRDAFKWARFYWNFCRKYGHDPFDAGSLPLFHAKLAMH
jgi:hypothetical protein